MERLKSIVIISVEVLVVAFIIVFIAVYYGASRTESSYQSAIGYMKKGNWNNALYEIEQIPHYKDSSELYTYIYPNNLYYRQYTTTESAIAAYNMGVKYIDENGKQLDNKNGEKYVRDFNALKGTFKFKIEELGVLDRSQAIEKTINDIVAAINIGDLNGALSKLNSLGSGSMVDTVKKELIAYIDFLNASNANDDKAIMNSIKNLDPNYTGVLSNEISTAVQVYADMSKWTSMYKAPDAKTVSSSLTIGMKKDDVIKELGNPKGQSSISNKYGSFDILNYDNKTIYFENGMLTAVKE